MFPIKLNTLQLNTNDKNYIYIGKYNTILENSELLKEIFKLSNKCSENDIIDILKKDYDVDKIKNQLSILKEWFLSVENKKKIINSNYESNENDWLNKKLLSSLWLNISHDCNLRCLYCYGSGGSYGGKRKLMTINKAKEIIDYWFKYLNIDSENISVAFFGGEPLMNKKVLIFSVNYINKLLKKYNRYANYVMTTNGTILDDELFTFFKENAFKVTISIDGGKKIQDFNRPFVSGKGSFNTVAKTIKTLRQSYHGLVGRLTLTHNNVYYFKDSVEELWKTGITNINYDIVSSNDINLKLTHSDLDILKSQISELSKITYKNIINDNSKVLLPLIKYGKIIHNYLNNNTCPFYTKSTLVVDPNGEIFKCHRFADNNDFSVGNISTGLNWDRYCDNKSFNTRCSSCWASSICTDCAQVHYISNIDSKSPDIWCEHQKLLIEESLKLYINLCNSKPNLLNKYYCL
jgi:uncharacterized protein